MNILLYSPDNGVTRNFMPHLWMFLPMSLSYEAFQNTRTHRRGPASPSQETA
jgi:hypothetical protein